MAAWGNMKNIFENPLMPESYSPCRHLLPSTSSIDTIPEHDNAAAAVEIFGELCYAEKSDFYPNSDAKKTEEARFGYMQSKSSNERSGFEKKLGGYIRSYSDVRQRIAGAGGLAGFPPPITTIGSGGKPRVYFKSFREDGRFVLREIRIPTQRLLQAKREDGRLTMRVLRTRDEEEETKDGGEEERVVDC